MIVRRLTESGIGQFAAWLRGLAQVPGVPPPRGLLEDEAHTESLGVTIDVQPQTFPRRFEAAEYLYGLLHGRGLREPERDAGLWAWLSLFFIDQVCPPDGSGRRKAGEMARYIPAVHRYDRYYRHLLLGPFLLYAAHSACPATALGVLANPVHKPGDVVEQFASRKYLATSAAVMGACTRLYVKDGAYKRGAQGGGSSPQGGTSRRLADFVMQIDRTFDIGSLFADSLLAMLPKEFQRFLRDQKPA